MAHLQTSKKRNAVGRMGLYYPYIHFQDENWLKLATLYWDRMGRIVPDKDDVNAEDSDFVRALKFEVDFVKDLRPQSETQEVGSKFLELLKAHETKLRSRYGIKKWNQRLRSEGPDRNRRHSDDIIETVYAEKMSEDLRQSLVDTGLAYAPMHKDFLIMHRRLADVYMTVLADAMARQRDVGENKYEPTTDTIDNHYAVSGGGLEHIKNALLPLEVKKQRHDVSLLSSARVALFALEMTVPVNIADVTLKQIIKFRKKYKKDVCEFHQDVADFVSDQQLLETLIQNPTEFQKHLEKVYAQKVQKKLDKLGTVVTETWKDTALSMLYVSPMALIGKGIPALIPGAEPVSIGVAAFALGAVPALRKSQKELKTKVGPQAYLLHAREYFEPKPTHLTRIKRWARKFFFRV